MRMQPEQKNNFDAPRSSHGQRPYRLYNRRSSFVVNGNAFFLTASRGRLHWSEKAVAEKKKAVAELAVAKIEVCLFFWSIT